MVCLIKKFGNPFGKPLSKQRSPSDQSVPNADSEIIVQSLDNAEIHPEKSTKKLDQSFLYEGPRRQGIEVANSEPQKMHNAYIIEATGRAPPLCWYFLMTIAVVPDFLA